jgi:hypothetical protein
MVQTFSSCKQSTSKVDTDKHGVQSMRKKSYNRRVNQPASGIWCQSRPLGTIKLYLSLSGLKCD